MTTELERAPLTIAGNPVDVFEVKVSTLPELAKSIAITDQQSYALAGSFRSYVQRRLKERRAHYVDAKAKSWAAHQANLAMEHADCDPIEAALKTIDPALTAYEDEQDRIRRAEESRLLAEAERRAAVEALDAAILAEQSGASADEVEAVLCQPAPLPVFVVPPAPKPQGQYVTTRWKVRYGKGVEAANKLAALRHIIAHPEFLNCTELAWPILNKLGSAQKQLFNFPGLESYPDKSRGERS